MSKVIAIFTMAVMAIGLSGCNNNDDCEECAPRCSCRAPLVGHAEAVPAPAPLADALVKAPETPVIAQRVERPAVIAPSIERSYTAPRYTPNYTSSKVRTGETQEN